ncbi:hypothetical protein HYH03_004271 [Edaphochlamys debaryana]|uniref:Uncharacterized protein n=1 Tax=Edaphochlamys debaryana TaxID=47281 RepID=A0A836C3N5_9CHLO|nr:hypothetical protein HYH03_004271 [Edaphochlamys debaryana]|eukprot:KAG2498013.1 hypothetical protein HYH03_004271 [Edaphochlamys debaryana]
MTLEKAAVTLLEGIRVGYSLSPACSCTKGLAVATQVLTQTLGRRDSFPGVDLSTSAATLSSSVAAAKRSFTETSRTPSRTQPTAQPALQVNKAPSGSSPVPDLELAAEGELGAREAVYLAMMQLPR